MYAATPHPQRSTDPARRLMLSAARSRRVAGISATGRDIGPPLYCLAAWRLRGFTVIELMLIVGLIGLLVALAFPAYSSHRNRARSLLAAQEIATMAAIVQHHWQDARAYPDSLAQVGLADRTDPWGRPYVYYNVEANGRGHARKDRALNPINADFDLYSQGPDGKTKPQITQKDSVDDVIRASSGAFVGVAADF